MPRVRAWFLVVVTAWCVAGVAVAQSRSLREVIDEAEALGAVVGCAVCDPAGAVQFAHRADRGFVPASNQKLLTAIAALHALGSSFLFETAFRLEDGVLRVYGCGDPNWAEGTSHAPSALFEALALRLAALGVSAVRGVEPVEGTFVGPTRPPTWPADQLHLAYCAPTGALVLECGSFRVRLDPDTGGPDAAITELAPALPIDGEVELVAPGRHLRPHVRQTGGRLVLSGAMARGAPAADFAGAVDDPIAVFRATLIDVLAKHGIRVTADAPAANAPVGAHRSTLAEALPPMLRDSSNFHAEQILRVMGDALLHEGTFAGGARAIAEQLTMLLGDLPDVVRIVDGSGLSRDNQVTPRVIGAALAAAAQKPWGGVLREALPKPGDGTLRRRFRASAAAPHVVAKTGWIRGASALSGYVGDRAFSILINYDPQRDGLNTRLKALQEAMVEAIDRMEPR